MQCPSSGDHLALTLRAPLVLPSSDHRQDRVAAYPRVGDSVIPTVLDNHGTDRKIACGHSLYVYNMQHNSVLHRVIANVYILLCCKLYVSEDKFESYAEKPTPKFF